MGAKAVIGTITVVAVLAGGAYVADGVVRERAQDRVAEQVQAELQLDTTPEVEAHGLPFLLQLARGSLDDVTVTAQQATLEGLPLEDIHVRLQDLAIDAPHVARHAEMTAFTPLSALQDRVGIDVPLRADGEHLVATLEVFTIEVDVVLRLEAAGREIKVGLEGLRAAGAEVDPAGIPGLGELDGQTFSVDGLPEGLALTDIDVQDDGVVLRAEGTDVALEPPG